MKMAISVWLRPSISNNETPPPAWGVEKKNLIQPKRSRIRDSYPRKEIKTLDIIKKLKKLSHL